MYNIEHISRLENIMDDAIRINPHAADIINAFRPIILKREQLVDTILLDGDKAFTFDESRFKQGVPLFEQNSYFDEDDPFESVCISLIPALKKGFPKLNPVWENLRIQIENKSIRLLEYFLRDPSDRDVLTRQWADQIDSEPQIIYFIANMVTRTILKKRAQNWETLIKGFDWDKGFCPVCGALPAVAMIKEGTSARWLHCSQCAHEWSFSRVICPGCENKDQKSMTYFHIEDKELESTFVCEKCKRYLITLNKVSDLAEIDADIMALGLAHLDMIMQEKGFMPMSEPEWGIFS